MHAIRLAAAALLASTGPLASLAGGVVMLGAPSAAAARGCSKSSYVNSRGRCVHRPARSSSIPHGASAQCRDGTYSFSQSRRGTCSYHGGVARWL